MVGLQKFKMPTRKVNLHRRDCQRGLAATEKTHRAGLWLGQARWAHACSGSFFGRRQHLNAKADVIWHIAMRPGKRRKLDKTNEADAMLDQAEKLKAGVRAKVEHPSRVVKRQFGFVKVRYPGLKKNTAQLFTLFALSNLWMVRSKLMQIQG